MSKAKYTVTRGLAQIISTGEPVYVKHVHETEGLADIVRPVVTQNGIEYREEVFSLEQLETRFEQAKRAVEMEGFVRDLREAAENKRYTLSVPQITALQNNAARS